ncbi:MAG: hypothetical protein IKK09_03380 [Clostridia bacterium]|nr:hypothetical protein [Clostridia bacterium]
MLGVVGKIKINYCFQNEIFEEIIDPQAVSEFSLDHCDKVKFVVEEIVYVEDTVYGVVLRLIEPNYVDDEFFVGSTSASFEIKDLGVNGTIALCF